MSHPMPPRYYPPPVSVPEAPNDGKKFLNMSGGVLALVISGVIALCCIGPFVLCVMGGMLSAITGDPYSTPTP